MEDIEVMDEIEVKRKITFSNGKNTHRNVKNLVVSGEEY